MEMHVPISVDQLRAQQRKAVRVRSSVSAFKYRAFHVVIKPSDIHGRVARHIEQVHPTISAAQTFAVHT